MAIESSLSSYQRREAKKAKFGEEGGPRPQTATQFAPRALKVKTEEVDFATRMKMMSGKAAPKRGLMTKVKKEVKDEPLSSDDEEEERRKERRRKKKKKKRHSSSSEGSEAEDKRITRKAKKKLGLSDSEEEVELTLRERDARTVVATQLSHKIRERDLKDFFSSVGDVRKVKLVRDEIHKTQGLAYVEFKHVQSVPLAMGLTGQRVLERAIVVHHSQGDKNRHSEMLEQARKNLMKKGTGPYKVKVSNLHPTVTEEQLKMISEPFGRIEKVTKEYRRLTYDTNR